jgi:hypothetical protein
MHSVPNSHRVPAQVKMSSLFPDQLLADYTMDRMWWGKRIVKKWLKLSVRK